MHIVTKCKGKWQLQTSHGVIFVYGVVVESINRDQTFVAAENISQFQTFYYKYMLPEIDDPVYPTRQKYGPWFKHQRFLVLLLVYSIISWCYFYCRNISLIL